MATALGWNRRLVRDALWLAELPEDVFEQYFSSAEKPSTQELVNLARLRAGNSVDKSCEPLSDNWLMAVAFLGNCSAQEQ